MIFLIIDLASLVIILIPLRLFQAKENIIINRISNSKAIALIEENNQKHTQPQITIYNCIQVFTCFVITFLKKFKQNILDNPLFKLLLLLLATNKIYLVKK